MPEALLVISTFHSSSFITHLSSRAHAHGVPFASPSPAALNGVVFPGYPVRDPLPIGNLILKRISNSKPVNTFICSIAHRLLLHHYHRVSTSHRVAFCTTTSCTFSTPIRPFPPPSCTVSTPHPLPRLLDLELRHVLFPHCQHTYQILYMYVKYRTHARFLRIPSSSFVIIHLGSESNVITMALYLTLYTYHPISNPELTHPSLFVDLSLCLLAIRGTRASGARFVELRATGINNNTGVLVHLFPHETFSSASLLPS